MYLLVKFQLCILKASEVTALQSSSNRKIDLYSKYRKNKLQAITKTDEWRDAQTQNLHHCVCHELRNGLLGIIPFTPLHHHKQNQNSRGNINCKKPLRLHVYKQP